MDNDIRRSIILDNYQNPLNRIRHDNDIEYDKLNTRNVSCIDNLDLYIKIKDGIIEDVSFDGEACVISISSTSILINLIIGKSIDDAINIIENYNNMIEEKDYDSDILEDALVFSDISKQPSRKKCATLSWNGIYNKLLELRENVK